MPVGPSHLRSTHGRRPAPATWSRWLAGPVALGIYLVAALATLAGPRHHLLPLFEGSGPPPPYQWVRPPPAFAAGNIPPKATSLDIALSAGTGKTGAAVVQTSDSQVIINFGAGAFSPPAGNDRVNVAIFPLDPATLGPLPPGSKPDGNAYHIELTYQPSATPIAAVAAASNLIISAPLPAAGLYYSADGRAWAGLPISTVAGPSVIGATFTQPGWYLVSTVHSPVAASTGGHGTVLIAIGVASGAAVLGLTAFVLARRKRRYPAVSRAKAGDGRPTGGRNS